MKARLLLLLYAAAWRLAFRPLQALAWLDRRWEALAGRGFLPAHWLAARRCLPESRAASPGGSRTSASAVAPTIWMHAASLGESKGLWALAECLLEAPPGFPGGFPPGRAAGFRILLTAQTATGLGFLERQAAAWAADRGGAGPSLAVDLAPLDHPDVVGRFLRRHQVAHVCLFEADLWPHYVLAASGRGIPVDLVSARMTGEAMARWRPLHGVWSRLLDRMEWILAQGVRDADRLRTLTRTPVAAGGDFKARHYFRERAALDGRGSEAGLSAAGLPAPGLPAPGAIAPGATAHGHPHVTPSRRVAFISLYLPELVLLLPEFPALMERFPLTVFPRLPQEMQAFRERLLPLGFALHGEDPGARHVLVDSLGKVAGILPSCGSALVGGSLVPRGCHNLWEPLLAGLKVYFGPSIHCQEDLAERALEKGVAEMLREPSGMRRWQDPDPGIAAACRSVMLEQMAVLEAGGAAFRGRMADVISRFYLFSGQPVADKRLPDA